MDRTMTDIACEWVCNIASALLIGLLAYLFLAATPDDRYGTAADADGTAEAAEAAEAGAK